MKKTLLWIFAIVFTLSTAIYQRMTGPTKPARGNVELAEETISYRLIRSYPRPTDAPVRVKAENEQITGTFIYKRTPSFDDWVREEMVREGEYLIAYIPQQPPAGKVMYQISLHKADEQVKLTESPLVIRFRGDVPAWAMIPHILFMFLAMLLSTRAGLAAIFAEKTFRLTLFTLVTLVLGGLVLGPIVQKFAFGDWWTGWPMGTDLTDNKTALAFLFWAYAMVKVFKNHYHRGWVLAASIILLLVYMIPHSLMGSEIDFTQDVIP